ncbi:sensor histidine kinase [Aquimarina spongiae]|uniref:Histidine kinase n=1 Tax=Aquimarina spongiae TaxID=570521 RepID=A0A1M6BBG1_9FLAO|nr:histidine kinase [Aquimarina spongiae]SHI46104.1 Histidine kinase [Aquimarina spongiae]
MTINVLLKNRILKHTLFWIIYLLIWILLDVLYGFSFERATYNYLGCIIEIPFYYIHMYYLWPKFISRKKYATYFIIFIPLLVLNSWLVLLLRYYLVFPYLLELTNPPKDFFALPRILGLARSILLWFGPPTAIKILQDHFTNKINIERLEKEKKISELNFLKSQMNPHFLFNTLNNLYSLSLKSSKKTPQALLQLSNLLSYTLYDASEDQISLEKEIQHLNDYIELEKLRFGDRLNLQLEMEGDFSKVMITPLIIIPLAENAFKHCALNERGIVDISFKIAVTQNQLQINTVNPVANVPKEDHKNGIGVQNLSKRLQIIYPQKHTFKLEEKAQKFYTELCIDLNNA